MNRNGDPPRSDVARPALVWTDEGPRSTRFDDVYFSASDGLAEARAVFLAGCDLPAAWRGRRRFVVGELGFGTGLNVLALLQLWRETREPGAQLHVFSVEAFPLDREEAARALAAWPQLQPLASVLLDAWPDPRPGFHRLDLPGLDARLDLWIGEAAEGLAAWSGAADAWFLDGFAPARNPDMWRGEVLDLVANRSRPGARLATFTVAGAVRRALASAGFAVERRPGFGRKRERLEARFPDAPDPADDAGPPRIAVIGAGVAGAALVRAFRALGCEPLVVEAERPGAGASGNPCALVAPRLDAGLGPGARLHAQAFARAVQLYRREAPASILAEGAVVLEAAQGDAARFDRIAAWSGFAPGAVTRLSSDEAAARLEELPAAGGLQLRDALVLEPKAALQAWLGATPLALRRIARLERCAGVWRLIGEDGAAIGEADAVVIAGGAGTGALVGDLGEAAAPMRIVRGQVSWTTEAGFHGQAGSWGGYGLPMRAGGVLFGATHDRGDWGLDLRPGDEAKNRAELARGRPRLAAELDSAAGGTLPGRASLRAAAVDHMPLAGAARGLPGVHLLCGFGGRGFTLAPLLAEHLAAELLGAPSPLPRALVPLIDPARFEARRRRRGRPPPPPQPQPQPQPAPHRTEAPVARSATSGATPLEETR